MNTQQKKPFKSLGSNLTKKATKIAKGMSTPGKIGGIPTTGTTFATLKSTVTGEKIDIPETSSPIMDSKCKELDQSAAFMEAVLKGMKKQQKQLKQYLESGEDLQQALTIYAGYVRSSCAADDLGTALELVAKFEGVYKMMLNDLHTHVTKVYEEVNQWIQNSVPVAQGEKKKFELARKALDTTNTRLFLAQQQDAKLNKESKVKQLTVEREAKELAYKQQGDKSFAKIMDTVDGTKYYNVFQLHHHFEGYVHFFKTGEQYLQANVPKMEDLNSRAQAEQSNYKMATMKRPQGQWAPESLSGDSQKRTFATNLQTVCDRDQCPNNMIPFLDLCFAYLEERGLTTTGLFRVSPPKPALDAIREKIDKGVEVDIMELDEVHMVSGLIKLFLREMPSPLLTFELYQNWMTITTLKAVPEQITAIKQTIELLPPANKVLLERLLRLCTKILLYEEHNKMTVENLAIVLCPSILYDRNPEPLTMVQDIQRGNKLMVLMVKSYTDIFGAMKLDGIVPHSWKQASSVSGPPPPSGAPPSLPPGPPPPSNPPPSNPPPSNPPPAGPPPPGDLPPPNDLPAPRDLLMSEITEKISAPPRSATNPRTRVDANPVSFTDFKASKEEEHSDEPKNKVGKSDKTIITLEMPPIPLAQLQQMLQGKESTSDYYKRLYELFDGTFMFARAAFNLSSFSQEELTLLNSAFSIVGRAIKNMLAFIKDYTSKFPGEIGKRILAAANEVRPHIKDLITYIKAYNGGQKLDPSGLTEVTKEFLVGTYQMYLTCYRASQMDELTQAGHHCLDLISQLSVILNTTRSQAEGSHILNNLQNFILKFTSLLRSRLPDIVDSEMQQQISTIVEGAEQCIGDIFDEAREMLEENNLNMTTVMQEKINSLTKIVNEVFSLRPAIEEILPHADIFSMIESTWEQINSITELHQEDESPNMLAFVLNLKNLSEILKSIHSEYKNATEKPNEWINLSAKAVKHILSIKDLVDQVASSVEDDSLRETLVTYSDATEHFVIQFKICSTAVAFGIKIEGFDSITFIAPLKDFAFITYPFMYNFREAIFMIEGQL